MQALRDRGCVDVKIGKSSPWDAEVEFARAMEDYKHRSGRMFPTWCEVLEVLRSIGYAKTRDGSHNKNE
jgi:hypothetical protein